MRSEVGRLSSQAVFALGVLLASGWRAPGSVLQVPDPERSIAGIGDALAQCAPGDEIVIAPGIYRESLTLTTPSLTLRGTGEVVIEGIRVTSPPEASGPFPAVAVLGVSGIRLEDLHLSGASATSFYYSSRPGTAADAERVASMPLFPSVVAPGAPAVVVTNGSLTLVGCTVQGGGGNGQGGLVAAASRVVVHDSAINGGAGYATAASSYQMTVGVPGTVALHLVGSCAQLENCALAGGNGGSGGDPEHPGPGGRGGDGAILDTSSFALFTSSTLAGGNGGNATLGSLIFLPLPGGNGGDGLAGDWTAQVWLTDCRLFGGARGTGFLNATAVDGRPMALEPGAAARDFPPMIAHVSFLLHAAGLSPGDAANCDLNDDDVNDVADVVRRLAFCGP